MLIDRQRDVILQVAIRGRSGCLLVEYVCTQRDLECWPYSASSLPVLLMRLEFFKILVKFEQEVLFVFNKQAGSLNVLLGATYSEINSKKKNDNSKINSKLHHGMYCKQKQKQKIMTFSDETQPPQPKLVK